MKDMIQRMTEIEDTKKDQLNESIIECGDMPPAPMDMDRGNPVSINVNMNASGKDHVEDLLDMMKKAGLGGAEEVKPTGMPMRHDMEKFRSIVDPDSDPKMLPKPGEKPAIDMEDVNIEEGGMKDELIKAMEKIAADGYELLDSALDGAMGPDVQKYLQDMYNDVAVDNGLHPDDDFEKIHDRMMDQIEDDYGMGESYANEPEEDYKDTEYMTKDLSGGINREKKAYKAAQRGDNAMAVESLYNDLMAQYKNMK